MVTERQWAPSQTARDIAAAVFTTIKDTAWVVFPQVVPGKFPELDYDGQAVITLAGAPLACGIWEAGCIPDKITRSVAQSVAYQHAAAHYGPKCSTGFVMVFRDGTFKSFEDN